MTSKWYKYLPLAPAFILGLVLGKALQSEFGYIGYAAGFVMAVAFEAVNLALAEHTAEHANHRRFKLAGTTISFQVVYIAIAFAAIAMLGDGGTIKWFLALTPAIIGLALISGGLLQSVDAQANQTKHEQKEADEIARQRKIEDEERAHRRDIERQEIANAHRQKLKALSQQPATPVATPVANVQHNATPLQQSIEQLLQEGVTSKSEMARELKVNRSQIYRHWPETNGVTK